MIKNDKGDLIEIGDTIEYYSSKYGIVKAQVIKVTYELEDKFDNTIKEFVKSIHTRIVVLPTGMSNEYGNKRNISNFKDVKILKKFEQT